MSSPRCVCQFPESSPNPMVLEELKQDDTDVKTRITNFVNDCFDIIKELNFEGFKKFLQITSQYAYKFKFTEQNLSLADCMTIMIRDYNEVKVTNRLVGYYYDAMVFEFLQRSLQLINADQEQIDNLDNKIIENFNLFKSNIE